MISLGKGVFLYATLKVDELNGTLYIFYKKKNDFCHIVDIPVDLAVDLVVCVYE